MAFFLLFLPVSGSVLVLFFCKFPIRSSAGRAPSKRPFFEIPFARQATSRLVLRIQSERALVGKKNTHTLLDFIITNSNCHPLHFPPLASIPKRPFETTSRLESGLPRICVSHLAALLSSPLLSSPLLDQVVAFLDGGELLLAFRVALVFIAGSEVVIAAPRGEAFAPLRPDLGHGLEVDFTGNLLTLLSVLRTFI